MIRVFGGGAGAFACAVKYRAQKQGPCLFSCFIHYSNEPTAWFTVIVQNAECSGWLVVLPPLVSRCEEEDMRQRRARRPRGHAPTRGALLARAKDSER